VNFQVATMIGAVGVQLVGLLSIFIWVFTTSLLVWFLIKLLLGIRVDAEHEYEGVDISESSRSFI